MQDNAIHFGFINTPYLVETINRPMAAAKEEERRKKKRHFKSTMTADRVAGILEWKYKPGIVEFFWEKHEDDIMDLIKDIVTERLDKVVSGQWRTRDTSFANMAKPAFPKIEKMFRSFLDNREMDNMVVGVPTEKSKLHRKPSFVNSGIYRASFRVWAE